MSGVVLYWIYSSFGPVSLIAAPPLNVGGDQTIEAEEVGLDADVSHLPAASVLRSGILGDKT